MQKYWDSMIEKNVIYFWCSLIIEYEVKNNIVIYVLRSYISCNKIYVGI